MPVLEKKCHRSGCPAVLKLPRIKRLTIMLSKKFEKNAEIATS